MICPPRRLGPHGFTLVELLFTLLLIGILIGLAAPAMSKWIGYNKADRVLNQLTADLYYARMLAVKNGQPVTVRFTPQARDVCIRQYEILVGPPPERLAKRTAIADDSRGVCLAQNSGGSLRYNARGIETTMIARTFRAAHTSMGDSLRVALSQAGRIRRSN